NTGNFSAVYVASGGTLGTSEADIALEVDGALLASGAAAVNVDSGATATGRMLVGSTGSITGNAQGSINIAGTYTGTIENRGDINDGIFITGSQTSAAEAYISQGISSDNAVLTDGFNIGAGRTVTSTGGNTVVIGAYSTVDTINVDGTLSTSGTDRAAVYVAENGQVGTIDNDGTLSSTSGIAVVINGTLTNTIDNQGVIDGDILFGGSFSGSGHAYDSSGNNRLDGAFRVTAGGSVSSSSSHTVLIDTDSSADSVVVDNGGTLGNSGANSGLFVRGTLGDSASNSAIAVNGTLSSTSGTAVNIHSTGSLVGRITIGETGTVSGSTSAISISGDHDNMIENRGTITNNVVINSNQSSSGPAYYTWATTSTDTAELNGAYQVSNSSTVTSTGNHTVYLGANGSIDQVDIDSGSTLANSATGGNTIYVAAGGELGDLSNAAAVNVDGTLSATSGNAIRVDGTLTGTVNNSSTIAGGITIAGSHVASTSAYFSAGGDLDAYTVRAGATSGSTGTHGIYIGNAASVDVITVDGTSQNSSDRGVLATTDTESSAILVDTGGILGTTENTNALVVNGQVSSSEGHAIDINGTTLGKIMIGEFGVIAGGTGTDKAIVVDGTLTGTIENQGLIQDGIVITSTGTHVTTGKLYSAMGNDDSQASLTGGFTSQSGNVHSTGDHAIYTGDDAITDQVMVDSGATLGSTAVDRSGVLVASGGQLGVSETDTAVLLRGSLYSTQGNALQIDGTAIGKILLEQVGPASGGAITGLAADSAAVAINGTYVGMIENHFDIDGGIEVSGLHSSANEAYKAVGTSVRDAELTGTYAIRSGGRIQSTDADTLYLGANSYTDNIVIETNGSLVTTGNSKSAVHVAAGGLLGLSASGDAIDLKGVISSSQGEAINIAGIVSGRIRSTGDIAGGINISGTHTASVATYYSEGTATVVNDVTTINYASLNGGYTVANNGLAGSTGDHTVSVGQYGFIDQVIVETGGVISNAASGRSGVFVAENGLLGSSADSDSIRVRGRLSSNSGAAVGVEGQVQGTIRNTSGDINGDISVSGSHVASNAAYYAEGTDTKTATLAGAYRVAENGAARSTADHTVYTAAYGQTNGVIVENQGSLTSEAAGKSAIYVASLGQLGDQEASTTVNIDGSLSAASASAINIEGTGLGKLLVGNTGTVSGASGSAAIDLSGQYTGTFENRGSIAGINVDGNHSAANQAYFSEGLPSDTATLSGGYRVTSGGVTSSLGNHAIHLGEYSVIDYIEVSGSLGSQASSIISGASGMSGIYVGDGAQLGGFNSRGADDTAILISNNGLVGSATGSAIKVDGSLVGKILVDSATLGNSTSSIALDFSGSETALNYEQVGNGSLTRGSIIGSATNTNDTVTIRQGVFTGGTIRDVDNLIISDDASFTMTGDFTLPTLTTVELEQDFNSGANAGQAIITTLGELSAQEEGSTVYFKPESIEAYQALYNGGTLTLVDAGSVKDGTANLVTLDSSALVDVQAQVVNGDFMVVLTPQSTVDIGGVMGQALDAAINPNSGENDRVQEIVDVLNQPDEVVAEIGKQVKPDTTGHQQQVSRDLTLSSQNIIFDRTTSLRSGFNFGDSLIRFGGGGLWGQMVYIDGNQDQREQEAGYNNRLGGILLGLDAEFSDRLKLGVAATYGFGVVNTEDNRSTESHNFLGTLYSSWEYKRYFMDSILSMGGARNKYSQSLTTLSSQTSSEYDSTQWNLRFVTGARLPFGRSWEFTPMVELNYGKVSFDSYIEKGEHGFVKEVKFDNYSALELGLGFTLNGTMKRGKARIRPDVTFMAHRDLNSSGVGVKYTYLAGGDESYVTGPERDSQRYKFGFGLNFDMSDSFTVRTAYDYRMSSTYRSHNLNAKFRYDF
ncbi:MAG: autotransporter domain-containing protein, partial [Endozoicomonas sp.]